MGALEDLLSAPPSSRPTSLEQLLMPPQNPLAPPEWLARPTRGIAESLGNLLAMPKRAMEQGVTTEEAIPWGANVGMGMVGTPATPAGALGSSLKGIRAYHASPHDFDRFDFSKIGTGQGSQSFGHGIYVAENPAVSGRGGQYDLEFSRGLYSTNSGKQIQPAEAFRELYNATPSNLHPDHRRAVVSSILQGVDETGSAEKYLRSIEPPAMHRDAYAMAGGKAAEIGLGPGKAHIYEVNINAKPEQFLDWDRPLKDQPQIYDRLKSAAGDIYGPMPWNPREPLVPTPNTSGADAYRAARPLGGEGSKEFATSAFRDVGIPGIKYLDQGSRPNLGAYQREIEQYQKLVSEGAERLKANPNNRAIQDALSHDQSILQQLETKGRGTSNYVLFDDKLIDILRKYGLAGMAPTGGALGALMTQNPDTGN